MTLRLRTEHHLEFLSSAGGCICLSSRCASDEKQANKVCASVHVCVYKQTDSERELSTVSTVLNKKNPLYW